MLLLVADFGRIAEAGLSDSVGSPSSAFLVHIDYFMYNFMICLHACLILRRLLLRLLVCLLLLRLLLRLLLSQDDRGGRR